jgi:inorganic triphosphatase YgiF
MRTEVEAKFLATDSAALDVLAETPHLGSADLGRPVAASEVDRYLDTDDGRLAAAAWACRLRERDGRVRVSLKGPPSEPVAGAIHRRPEEEGPAIPDRSPREWPHSRARDLLLSLAGTRPLTELLRLRQDRVERGVAVRGARLATLSLDRVSIEHRGREVGRLAVVEIEADPGTSAEVLAPIVGALAAHPGLVPDQQTKLEHALALMGLERAAKPSRT